MRELIIASIIVSLLALVAVMEEVDTEVNATLAQEYADMLAHDAACEQWDCLSE